MPAAARSGDKTRHRSSLRPGKGSLNVFIGGKSAWRAIVDYQLCPQSSGRTPHVGGFVLQGSKSVFINNFPAARVGDKIIEAVSINTISSGEPTVIIGG